MVGAVNLSIDTFLVPPFQSVLVMMSYMLILNLFFVRLYRARRQIVVGIEYVLSFFKQAKSAKANN